MNPAFYAIVLIFSFLPLYATDAITSGSAFPSDSNISTEAVGLSVAGESDQNLFMENNATAYDLNDTGRFDYPDFLTGRNWFYYRGFLTGMDKVYMYGTDAVIVIGSGIDYSLYWLFSKDTNTTEQAGVDAAAGQNGNATMLTEEALSNEDNESVAQYISSQKGKIALPRQLASQDKREGERTYLLSEWFAEKAVSNDFLDRKNDSYIRLRGGYLYDRRGGNSYIHTVVARVMIPRTQKKFNLVIGDDTKNSSDLSLQGTNAERDNSIALGVNNVLGILEPVESKILFGFSGVTNPYAKAAFKHESLLGSWLMVPSQTFKYSRKEEFEEWTNLDFRRRIGERIMFSLLFQRSSESDIKGMDYFMQPSVSFAMGAYGNLTPYCGLYGRTRKQPEDADGYSPKRGVYRYAFGINWSKQASRKYIVYRLQPILSYDDQYDFRPNYAVKALLEFYFGLRD